MPEYLSPGVYIEEVETGPQPIEGVSTSTTGAVGVTVRGPSEGPPTLVTSFLDFVRTFGDFLPPPTPTEFNTFATDPTEGGRWWTFPVAVKGFFDNGGQRLFVKRVVSAHATFASGDQGQGLVSRVTRDAPATSTSVTLEHLIRIDTTAPTQLTFHRGDDGSLLFGPTNVTAYDPATNSVTIASTLAPLLAARGDFAVINTAITATNTLTFSAAARGVWGNDISVLVRPIVGASFSLLFDPALADAAATSQLAAPAAVGDPTFTIAAAAGFNAGAGHRHPQRRRVRLHRVQQRHRRHHAGRHVSRQLSAQRRGPAAASRLWRRRHHRQRLRRAVDLSERHPRVRQRPSQGAARCRLRVGKHGDVRRGSHDRHLLGGRNRTRHRGGGAHAVRDGRRRAGGRDLHRPAPARRRQPQPPGDRRQHAVAARESDGRRRILRERHRPLPRAPAHAVDKARRRSRQQRPAHPRRLRRRRRRQRPAHRHPGARGHRRGQHLPGARHVVEHRPERADPALRAAQGPLRHPRFARPTGRPACRTSARSARRSTPSTRRSTTRGSTCAIRRYSRRWWPLPRATWPASTRASTSSAACTRRRPTR